MSIVATPGSIASFALRVLGLCAAFFALWHFAYKPVSGVTGWAAARLVGLPSCVARATTWQQGRTLVFDIEPDPKTAQRSGLAPGAVFEVHTNPLKYTFGLPFFLALLFASRPDGLKWKALLGSAVVVGLAAVGLACQVLIEIGILQAPAGGPLFPMSGREAIALGYQLGTLIFPTVAPAMLWAAMDPRTLRQFGALGSRFAPK